MTRQEKIETARRLHLDFCRADRLHVTGKGPAPKRPDCYKHGWYTIEGESIGSREYAPGPTYDGH